MTFSCARQIPSCLFSTPIEEKRQKPCRERHIRRSSLIFPSEMISPIWFMVLSYFYLVVPNGDIALSQCAMLKPSRSQLLSFRLSREAFLSWSWEPLRVRLCGTLIDLSGGHPEDWQRSNAVQVHFCETKKHAERIWQFMSLWMSMSLGTICNSPSLFDTQN